MALIHKIFRIDPIVTEILKAGILTYRKHIKAYIVLNIVYIVLFAFIMGMTSSIESNLNFFSKVFDYANSFQRYTQTLFFYGVLGLIVTVITYYLTFGETLRRGELGIEIQAPWTSIEHFFIIVFYNFLFILYLIIWVIFFKILFTLLTFNRLQTFDANEYSFIFIGLIICIFLLISLFLFVVKYSYYVYMLDELKVPTEAIDPIILFYGISFGFLVLCLEIFNFFFPSLFFSNISIIITYLTPGTVLLPILGYSMAHLKVAQTLLGYEPLFINEEASPI